MNQMKNGNKNKNIENIFAKYTDYFNEVQLDNQTVGERCFIDF